MTGESNRRSPGDAELAEFRPRHGIGEACFASKLFVLLHLNNYIACSFASKGSTIVKTCREYPVCSSKYISNTDNFIVLLVIF